MTIKAQYGFAPGSRLGNKRDAQKVGEALAKLSKNGKKTLKAEDVLGAAMNPKSPLHKFFDWDDRSAARKYRLDTARLILRSVVVYHVDNKGQTTKGHEWYSIRQGRQITYVKSEVALSTPSLKERIVDQAKKEMLGWISRYESYKFLSKTTTKIKQAISSI